ncbi:MAG: hypothetical protein M1817_000135 [Caeruleum heppii]|nr:MAG: hypothetical protein M1817_000135 [Caeruleum heppii]
MDYVNPSFRPRLEIRVSGSGGTDQPTRGTSNLVISLIAVLGLLIVMTLVYAILRNLRIRYPDPRYLPTSYLKYRWRRWSPGPGYGPAGDNDLDDHLGHDLTDAAARSAHRSSVNSQQTLNPLGVDRNTSIRSIATLPAYKPTPADTEQVLGREGERGGIDVVVEFPETAEEEETRRDEEMEAIYQIRVARRAEHADREERRRRRREARERRESDRANRPRAESRSTPMAGVMSGALGNNESRTSLPSTPGLTAEDQMHPGRERRVSSVSYADVGLAVHDGTRVRSSSVESERPLLESAAPMGDISHSRHGSFASVPRFPFSHGRNFSATSSILSASTNVSETHLPHFDERRPSATEENHLPSSPHIHHPSVTTPPAQSPAPEPPNYEHLGWPAHSPDASHFPTTSSFDQTSALPTPPPVEGEAPPSYERPSHRPPTLPVLQILPSIEVTAGSPANSVPTTPVVMESGDARRR